MGHRYDVEHAGDLHVAWCRALADRAGLATTHQAAPQLAAVLHGIRAALPVADVVSIANALPTLERGIFLESWDVSHRPDPPGGADEFAARVYERVKGHHTPPATIVADVLWLLATHLPAARAAIIRDRLPAAIRGLWPADASTDPAARY